MEYIYTFGCGWTGACGGKWLGGATVCGAFGLLKK